MTIFKKPLLGLIIICLTAAIFRLFFFNLIEFKYDEAYTVFQMEQFYMHPYLMQVGPPQSTGVYNPPLFNFLMIILSLFSRSPQYLSFLIAFINVIFAGIFYLVVRKFYGKFTGVIAGLLLATSPWNIVFSRKIWIPDLLGPMMVIVFYYLHQVVLARKEKAVLPLFIFLTLIPQMHASGLFFTAATLLIFLITKTKLNFRKALIGVGIGLIPATPYIIRQLTSTPFCVDCVAFFTYQGGARPFDLENFLRPFNFLGGFNFQILLGESYPEFLNVLPFGKILSVLFVGEILSVIAAAFWIVKSQIKYLFLVLYLVIIPILYLATKTPAYMHYFVVLSLMVILLQSLFFKSILEVKKNQTTIVLIAALIGIVLAANVIFEISLIKFLSSKQKINGDYGPVFSVTQNYIKDQTESYQTLPDYGLLKSYSYMFAQTKFLHQKLGDYFAQTGRADLAISEFQEALNENNNDKYSRANLAYIDMQTGKLDDAKKEINLLSAQDSTLSARLQNILDNINNKTK